jgi:cell fate regulator YaaT (PSP1 superfamily)
VSQETVTRTTDAADQAPPFVVGVRFQSVGKVYHFSAEHEPSLREGDFVVVTTSRGQQLGQVATAGPLDSSIISGRLKPVDRRATGRDLAIRRYWENKELEALIVSRELNAEVGLAIKLIKAEYSFDGKQLTFLYSAEDRKETKALRQRLSRAFRAKVGLRQIGPRDVAKILGGYGSCGGPRCCSTFLTEFSPISIRMAKAQGVSLNPSEITGMCGRLRCCLIYEYEQYVEARKRLPKQGKRVGTTYGEGKVVSLFPLKETALVDLGERRVEVHREEIIPLEEWRALQEKAAQKCDHDEDCTCGRPKPDLTTRRPSEADRGPAREVREARRSPSGPEPTAQKPPVDGPSAQKTKGTIETNALVPGGKKSKSSRRRRRRRKKRR